MKIEFEDVLWAKVKRYAETTGYSSPEEFVQDTVERQIDAASSPEEDRRLAEKLQGLGYLDFGRDI
jgi:hypothetical protein